MGLKRTLLAPNPTSRGFETRDSCKMVNEAQTAPVAASLVLFGVLFGVRMNDLSIVKVRFLFLVEESYRSPWLS